MIPLPIDALLPEVIRALKHAPALVLQAAPGAGKTTRVPRALVEADVGGGGEVVVLQPRRLATRMAAARVAAEWGERVGGRVGYQIRFEDVGGPNTRLRFVTEGVLTRKLLGTPDLKGVGAVVLDEFHERHLAGDLALALLRRLQNTSRPDLKLVVMSATLDAAPVVQFLGNCPSLVSEGRAYPVEVEFLPAPDDRPLEVQVLAALKRTVQAGREGHVLVFLPGAREIRRATEACDDFCRRHGFTPHALHGELPAAEQDLAVAHGAGRKVIFSTNVAETSVTVEGVGVVIDGGLARVASQSPGSGLPALKLSKVSKASAAQRTGRAGRTRAGHCFRLYTRADFDGRPAHELPEIRRLDLTDTVLALKALGVDDAARFPFFEAPSLAAVEASTLLLRRLGALDAGGAITPLGRRMLTYPVHPRLSRVMLDAEARSVGEEGAALAALLGEREIRHEARAGAYESARGKARGGASDALEALERFNRARQGRFSSRSLQSEHLDPASTQAVERVRARLSKGLRAPGRENPRPAEPAREEALLQSLLAGFPDRVAKRRKPHAPELLLFGGGTATLSPLSAVHDAEFLVALVVEESARTGSAQILVRSASEVRAEWLLDAGAGELSEVDELTWNAADARVERLTRLAYGNLILEETRSLAAPSDAASHLLAKQVLAAGAEHFFEPGTLETLRVKVGLLRAAYPQAGFETLDEAGLQALLESLCQGLRSFQELRQARPSEALTGLLSPELRRALAAKTPDTLTLPGGRKVHVHYEPAQPPWCESRLQDFFGSASGPSLCDGRVPLTLHLLAPNGRAVQVTQDLAGFWERHYPALRRELSRRYPRHAWPEAPLTAQPPTPSERRRGRG